MLFSVMLIWFSIAEKAIAFHKIQISLWSKQKQKRRNSKLQKTVFFLYPVKTTMLLKLTKATQLGAPLRPLRNQKVHVRYDIDTTGNLVVFPNSNLKNHSGGGWGLELSPK